MDAYDVRDYGAVGDGETFDTTAINEAIEACHDDGGGLVRVPAGTYRTGSIRLRSGVHLQLDAEATIRGASNELGRYDEPLENPHDDYQDFGHSHWRNSLLWAEDATDVAIRGGGVIDGTGMSRHDEVPSGSGDTAVGLRECRGVDVEGVTILEGGHFAVLATGCDRLRIRNVEVDTSRDGINLVACRDTEVRDSRLDCLRTVDGEPVGGDDAIGFKSDFSLGYERTSERLRVENCTIATGCNAIQFGSETVGDFRDVVVRDVDIEHAGKAGIGVTTNDGAIIEDVEIADVRMRNARVPIFFQITDRGRAPGKRPVGTIRDVRLEDVSVTEPRSPDLADGFTSSLTGHPDGRIQNVTFENVELRYPGDPAASDVDRQPPVEPDGYQPRKIGTRPAAGLYCRYVRGLDLRNVRVIVESEDDRPTLVFDDAGDVTVDRLTVDRPRDGDDVWLRNTRPFSYEN